jgi:hypothetical protein
VQQPVDSSVREPVIPAAIVPYEAIKQWDDHVWTPPRANPHNGDIYTTDESTRSAAIKMF